MRNNLLRALQTGVLSPDDLTDTDLVQLGVLDMPQPRNDIAPMADNTMRTETGPDAGRVISLSFRGQPKGPSWDDVRAATAGGQGQQPQAAAPAPMRVVGWGNGAVTELSPEAAGGEPQLDYSRGGVDIAGVGKGYYGKDGRNAYVRGPDGQMTKVILGYDREGSMDLNKWYQDQRAKEATIAQTLAQTGSTEATTAHTRESTAALRAQTNIKEDTTSQAYLEKKFGKLPDGQRWTMDGRVEEIPGAVGKLNENQGKAMTFGQRAAEAHEALDSIGQGGKVQPGTIKRALESIPAVGGALGTLANWTQDPAQQQVEQAQRNFINAVLRRESGATIQQSEFDNAARQYFPQPGDGKDVIAQKRRNREVVIQGLAEEAGPAKSKVAASWERAKAVSEARQAVRDGKNKAMVASRLQQMGINPGEAGL